MNWVTVLLCSRTCCCVAACCHYREWAGEAHAVWSKTTRGSCSACWRRAKHRWQRWRPSICPKLVGIMGWSEQILVQSHLLSKVVWRGWVHGWKNSQVDTGAWKATKVDFRSVRTRAWTEHAQPPSKYYATVRSKVRSQFVDFIVSHADASPAHNVSGPVLYHYSGSRYFSWKKLTSVMARWSSLIICHCRRVFLDTAFYKHKACMMNKSHTRIRF